jgi:hypothetical protein
MANYTVSLGPNLSPTLRLQSLPLSPVFLPDPLGHHRKMRGATDLGEPMPTDLVGFGIIATGIMVMAGAAWVALRK